TAHSHDSSRHVFVTTGYRNDPIIVLTATYGFNAVCNHITGDQRIAHTICPVTHPITHTDGPECQSNQIISPHTFFHDFCQVIQVHITRIAIIAHTCNTDLCFIHICICQSNPV